MKKLFANDTAERQNNLMKKVISLVTKNNVIFTRQFNVKKLNDKIKENNILFSSSRDFEEKDKDWNMSVLSNQDN